MRFLVGFIVAACGLSSVTTADVVEIVSARDNTIYSESINSNGAGTGMFAGNNSAPNRRRAMMYFDVAASLPAGATVLSARLRLHQSSANVGNVNVELHRALSSWGEGTSAAGGTGGGGSGVAPTPGDATWVSRFHPGTAWTTAGGDFDAAASATSVVGGTGFFEWTSAALSADVSSFYATPSANLGWELIGDETVSSSAKRFATREEPLTDRRPTLIVEFIPAPADAALLGVAGLLGVSRRRR